MCGRCAIGDSYFLSFLDKILEFFLISFRYSFFVKIVKKTEKLYPEIWEKIDSKNIRVDIFSPEFIFPAVYLCFVAASPYRISNLALFSILVGVAFFILGTKLARGKFSSIVCEEKSEKIAAFLFLSGIISLFLDLYYCGSIPLFNPFARRMLNVPLTMLSMLTVPSAIFGISIFGKKFLRGEIDKKKARIYSVATMLGVTFLISLLGYRTQTIVCILGCTIAMFYFELIGVIEILVSLLAVILLISGLGYYRAIMQGSSVGFVEIIGKRVALTLSVYDIIVNKFSNSSGANIFLATFSSVFRFIPGPRLGPRVIVARTILPDIEGISITSTLYGTVALGFGILGIAIYSVILGYILALCHRATKQTHSSLATSIFSLLLAYTIVGIETGIVDFNVVMFFLVGFLAIYKSRGRI